MHLSQYPRVRQFGTVSGVADALANLARVSPVVAALDSEERAALGEQLEVRFFERGDRLAVDGMDVDGLHFIVSGEVAILAHAYGAYVSLGPVGPGETVGDVELVLCRRSTIDAVATRPTATLFLSREEYGAVVVRSPNLLLSLYSVAVRRRADARLAPPPVRALPPPRVREIDAGPESPSVAPRPGSLAPANLPLRSAPSPSPEPSSTPSRWIFAGAALGAAIVSVVLVVASLIQPILVAHQPAATPAAAAAPAAVTTSAAPPATTIEPPASAPVQPSTAGAHKPRARPRRSAESTRDTSATASAASSAAAESSALRRGEEPRATNVRTVSSADDFGGRE